MKMFTCSRTEHATVHSPDPKTWICEQFHFQLSETVCLARQWHFFHRSDCCIDLRWYSKAGVASPGAGLGSQHVSDQKPESSDESSCLRREARCYRDLGLPSSQGPPRGLVDRVQQKGKPIQLVPTQLTGAAKDYAMRNQPPFSATSPSL